MLVLVIRQTKTILESEGELSQIMSAGMGQMLGFEQCPALVVVQFAFSTFFRNLVLNILKIDRDRRPALNGS
jgi:hypothetical protein